jgi:small-conductance mechanosensitive channel
MLDVLFILGLFLIAWGFARASALFTRRLLAWHDRLHGGRDVDLSGKIQNIKRRETTVIVIRTGIAYAAFAGAAVLSVSRLTGGFDRLTALAGASFFLIVAGFAVQRVLIDMIAGFTMFAERWFSVGDTIAIPMMELQGVVEDISLRRTKLRAVDGEVIHVHNSQIAAVRVLPTGAKELAIELFVSDGARGQAAAFAIADILPEGPTTFLRRPWIERVDDLADTLVRIRLRATVAPGREWLVEGFLSDLLKERAADVIVHGPVVLAVDETAARSFARASAATRWGARRAA